MTERKWYAKLFHLLFAVGLVVSLGVVALPMAGTVLSDPGTIQVDVNDPGCVNTSCQPDPYSVVYCSIQDAIDDANAGDTIEVATGTYDEIVVIGLADLTVQASSTPVIQPTTAASWPNMGAVNIMADGVKLDGFEVDGSLMPGNHEVINAYGVSDITISNNTAHGATSGTWDGMGIVVWDWTSASTVDNALIENNEVYDTGRMGIFCMDYDTTNNEYDLTEGHIIHGNTVHDTWLKGNDWGDAGGGIQINVGKHCSITDNIIYNTASSTFAGYYNPCIYMFGSGSGNTITGNTMRDSASGITLWISGEGGSAIDWEGDTPTSPTVSCNDIYDNSNYGAFCINVAGTTMTMDAKQNWWGDSSGPSGEGPGTGDAVSTNVDYSSWLPMEFQYCAECGGTPPSAPPSVPTVNDWGIIAMITLFAGFLAWTVRRRRQAL